MWHKNKREEDVNPQQKKEKRKRIIEKDSYIKIKHKVIDTYNIGVEKTKKSIRLEILCMVGISFVVSSITFTCVSTLGDMTIGRYSYTTNENNRESVEELVLNGVNKLNSLQANTDEYINVSNVYDMITQDEKTAVQSLKRYLEDITNQYIEIKQEQSITPLYNELNELQKSGDWSDEEAIEIIVQFMKDNNMDLNRIFMRTVKEKIRELKSDINNYCSLSEVYFTDSTGKLVYFDNNVVQVDLAKCIQSVNQNYNDSAYKAIYPVVLDDTIYYLYIGATLEEETYYGCNEDFGNIIGFMAAVAVFILLVTRLTKDKIAYIEYLSSCLGEISKGDLSYNIEVVGEDELARVAQNITIMEQEINSQIDAQIKAEKAKNELVTNVAHDLRTPLTSIIGYMGLVKEGAYQTQEEYDKYLNIAYEKSQKLKVIIEDLFELTKLHQDSVKLNKEMISISNLLNQLIEELMPLANEKNIEIQTYIDPTTAEVNVDVAKITRVFENLIENAIKYSEEGNAVYVELKEFSKSVYVAVSNYCDNIPQEEVDKFFERFYRADQSRNSQAGGSGLGLAIAKNIVELHGGKINAKVNGDLISFKVGLPKVK
ncbi:HAMP domain-containing sensor histidine kinase [Cellulosilyticum ruminicola]|uniref:HAMP domain-containing sensor histidine kinase n=1 Tax=Cellulosilyticum ruminicola TaxID=425254 RepID=UPI0006D2A555|nr:HAMP domain-containing sensor histidine kinase [Cellulosilyticum ruminicola]